jgi:type IV pilus assembly protein PilM
VAKRIVGVDIGWDTIRAVEVENPDRSRPVVTRVHEIGLPSGAVASGEVREVNTVTSAMRKLWSAGGFKTRSIVIGIGNQRTLARDLTVPRMGSQQIRESLPFQVQDLLPVPVAEALLDFYPVSEGQGDHGPVIHGLLVAAVKESVLANIRAMSEAGLTTSRVDLIPFALSRALFRGNSIRGTMALIDVGANTTTVVVATDGVPQFVRIVPSGGRDISTALMNEVQASPDVAEQIKRQRGMMNSPAASPAEQHAMKIMQEIAMQQLTNLKNTLNYFSASHQTEIIQSIVLSGRGATLPGFAQRLGELAGLPVLTPDPFATVELSRSVRKLSQFERMPMTTALGLAIGSAV